MSITPVIFTELSAFVTKFIAEKDGRPGNAPSLGVETATHLLIAIANAENIFRDCSAEWQPLLTAKEQEFKLMIACLQKLDYCRLNLTHRIRHSIDTGTSDGWIPKLYAVNPQYVVPKPGFTVQFFGKFKYANPARYGKTYMPKLMFGKHSFEPLQADHHTLTFNPTLSDDVYPFQADKCSQFFGRLIVPYEVGNLGLIMSNQRTFEFNVPIRALPTIAGIIEITFKMINDQISTVQHKMAWEETRTVEFDTRFSQLTFISFDGRKQEFLVAELEVAAKKIFPEQLTRRATYLTISQVAAVGEDRNKWKIETIPPVGI